MSQIWPILDRELKFGINHNVSKFINSEPSQDFLDFTATNYDICNPASLVIFSINQRFSDIWFFTGDMQKVPQVSIATYCMVSNLTQTRIYDISNYPSNDTSISVKLLNH